MKVDDFDFDLPAGLIAQDAVEPRDAARLLHVPAAGAFRDLGVRDLPALLEPGDLMIFNDTRVVPAKLRGLRDARVPDGTPAKCELTLHKRIGGMTWHAFAKPARKLMVGDRINVAQDFHATVREKLADGEIVVDFDRAGRDLDEALETYGEMPLPPYIKRGVDTDPDVTARDRERYQTMFAARNGAVAAPTAGLHFTPDLMAALRERGIRHAFVTLHVGAGTFLPVKTDDTDDHRMHAEWGSVGEHTAAAIAETRAQGGNVIAVGTTSLRLLESAAMDDGVVPAFSGETDIFITPGYRFRAVDRLMTNFHLPRSTLFMLVAAFAGLDRMRHAYRHAISEGYRFYSYGDACFLDRNILD